MMTKYLWENAVSVLDSDRMLMCLQFYAALHSAGVLKYI